MPKPAPELTRDDGPAPKDFLRTRRHDAEKWGRSSMSSGSGRNEDHGGCRFARRVVTRAGWRACRAVPIAAAVGDASLLPTATVPVRQAVGV